MKSTLEMYNLLPLIFNCINDVCYMMSEQNLRCKQNVLMYICVMNTSESRVKLL